MTAAALLLLLAALPLSAEEPAPASGKGAASGAATAPQAAASAALVFFESGTNTKSLAEQLAPFRKAHPQRELTYITVTNKCRSLRDAENAAKAIAAGITEMPALVLCDAGGAYAALPLRGLTAETLAEAEKGAAAPDRKAAAAANRYLSEKYLLFARMGLTKPLDATGLNRCLRDCRALMADPRATTEDRQLLGLRVLYPLLLEEYRRGYAKAHAHTPATEAKLLEAIAALEEARDLDTDSKLGKQAAAERERLRAARRQARTAE